MKKNIGMYNPELVTKSLRNKNLPILCSTSFCTPKAYIGIYNKNKKLRNGFHKSIPTRKVKELRRLGAISGIHVNHRVL